MRFPVLTVAIWNKKLLFSQNWFQVRNPKTKLDYKDGFTILEIPLGRNSATMPSTKFKSNICEHREMNVPFASVMNSCKI